MKKNVVLAVFAVSLLAQSSWAGYVNKSRRHQPERINQGVRSGTLTRAETKDLRGDQKDLRQEERELRKDGFTAEERKKMRQDRMAESKKIYQEKHDGENRGN